MKAIAEVGDVLVTIDGHRICVGRDAWDRQTMEKLRVPENIGAHASGWTYYGTAWIWDKEKKAIIYSGNWNKYSKKMIREVKKMTVNPKTGEPQY